MGMLAAIFISKKSKCSFVTLTSVPGLTTHGAQWIFVVGDKWPSAFRQFRSAASFDSWHLISHWLSSSHKCAEGRIWEMPGFGGREYVFWVLCGYQYFHYRLILVSHANARLVIIPISNAKESGIMQLVGVCTDTQIIVASQSVRWPWRSEIFKHFPWTVA